MKKIVLLISLMFFWGIYTAEHGWADSRRTLRSRSVSSSDEQNEGRQKFALSFLAGLLTHKLLLGKKPSHQRAYDLGDRIAKNQDPLIQKHITWATLKLTEHVANLVEVMACFNKVSEKAKASFFAEDADLGAESRIEGWLISTIKEIKLP